MLKLIRLPKSIFSRATRLNDVSNKPTKNETLSYYCVSVNKHTMEYLSKYKIKKNTVERRLSQLIGTGDSSDNRQFG